MEINPDLVKRILDRYAADSLWAKVHKQIINNKVSSLDKTILFLLLADSLPSNSDSYFQLRTKKSEEVSLGLDINDLFLTTAEDWPIAPGTGKS